MIAALPFVVQGAVLVVDEFWCHWRRDLRRWERLGHPFDTATFLACLAWTLLAPPSSVNVKIFEVMAVVSCLIVTKDEWEHRAADCDGFENWLHALLFMLHPTLLIWTGYLWTTASGDFAFTVGLALTAGISFCIYQIGYWNFWRPARDQ